MTPKEAIDFINNEVNIDVRFCSEEKVDKTIEVFEFAIKVLEKQIPKKPIEYRFPDTNRVFGYACPTCKTDEVKDGEYRYYYCRDCGQAIDWSDTEC